MPASEAVVLLQDTAVRLLQALVLGRDRWVVFTDAAE